MNYELHSEKLFLSTITIQRMRINLKRVAHMQVKDSVQDVEASAAIVPFICD